MKEGVKQSPRKKEASTTRRHVLRAWVLLMACARQDLTVIKWSTQTPKRPAVALMKAGRSRCSRSCAGRVVCKCGRGCHVLMAREMMDLWRGCVFIAVVLDCRNPVRGGGEHVPRVRGVGGGRSIGGARAEGTRLRLSLNWSHYWFSLTVRVPAILRLHK